MWQFAKRNIFYKEEIKYLEWLFPKSKRNLVNGLIFTFITITALSLVDYFFYAEAYYSELKPAQEKPFGIDAYFRLIFVPILTIGLCFLAKSKWNNSTERLNWIAAIVVFTSLFAFIGSGLSHEYYSADDFTFDMVVLLVFIQTLLGLNFRRSLLLSAIFVGITLSYIWMDDLEIKIQMYNTTLVLLLWIPVLFGAYWLDKSQKLNFRTISKLKTMNEDLAQSSLAVAKQKKLLWEGERVSKLASWEAKGDLSTIQYSSGVYSIFELNKKEIDIEDIYTITLRLTHPEDLKKVAIGIKGINEGNSFNQTMEFRLLMPDGRIKWIKYTIGEERKGKNIVGTVQDITESKILDIELKNTLSELKIKNEDLQQFAYASSHDLQEPLRTITNFGSLLNLKLGDQLKGDQKIYLDYILKSTTRMRELITAILDYSRIGKNKEKEKFDCNEIMKDILNDLDYSIQQAKGVVKVSNLPVVIGYKTEVSLMFQNLISNALKFRRKEIAPIIHVSYQSNTYFHTFRVKDNGIGIEEQHRHKIFHLFSRLHGKEDYKGTGIGLTHSKKIVELHGGRIWVESSIGGGSTFVFTISKALKITTNEKKTELYRVD